MNHFNRKKYITIFFITLGIFVSVFLVVSFINKSKNENISDLQRRITIDLIANETQFDLLKNAPCKAIEGNSILSRQMNELGKKLIHAEEVQGIDNKQVLELKKYYSLLEVKDYLLSQEVAKKCDIQIESIIYFYDRDCGDCEKQGYVLTELKRKYPWLRIYSFDKDLDFSIVKTFAGLYAIHEKNPPILIIGEDVYSGFKKVEEIEELIPALHEKKIQEQAKEEAISFIRKDERFQRGDIRFVSLDGDRVILSFTTDDGGNEEKVELERNDEGNFAFVEEKDLIREK